MGDRTRYTLPRVPPHRAPRPSRPPSASTCNQHCGVVHHPAAFREQPGGYASLRSGVFSLGGILPGLGRRLMIAHRAEPEPGKPLRVPLYITPPHFESGSEELSGETAPGSPLPGVAMRSHGFSGAALRSDCLSHGSHEARALLHRSVDSTIPVYSIRTCEMDDGNPGFCHFRDRLIVYTGIAVCLQVYSI